MKILMGYWTEVEGQIRAKHVSIRKIVEKVLDGEDYVLDQVEGNPNGWNPVTFSLRFEKDGESAIKLLNKIADEVKSLDKHAYLSIDIVNMNLILFGKYHK